MSKDETLEASDERGERRDRVRSVPDRAVVPSRIVGVIGVAIVEGALPAIRAECFGGPVRLRVREPLDMSARRVRLSSSDGKRKRGAPDR